MLERNFEAVAEDYPGHRWQGLFQRHWPAYRRWFLGEGARSRPYYLAARRALRIHMPELLPLYEHLCELAGGGDTAARFLPLYCPPAYVSGCSQAVWPGEAPALIRNYDYDPTLLEGVILKTRWHGREVIAMSDCLWGVVDGINDAGLALSLTFGGRRVVGQGFGMPLILRYVLEFCDSAREAATVLSRVPSHMAYNVTALDRHGEFLTVHVSPDRPAVVRADPVTTNHQRSVEWREHGRATATRERERFLNFRLREASSAADLLRAFLRTPVYHVAYGAGFGTLYTAVYRPDRGASYLWPDGCWEQSFGAFQEGIRTVRYPTAATPRTQLH